MHKQFEVLADARMFMKSRVILTGAELDLFTKLHGKAASSADLAGSAGLDKRALTRLLDCLVTFGLLDKNRDTYSATKSGALFSSDHPQTVLPMALHLNGIWENWSRLTDSVKSGSNPGRKPVAESKDDSVTRAFIEAMHVIGQGLSREIARAYDAGGYKRLLDIGGGSGTYTVAFLSENPQMEAVIFDLDRVIPMAEARIKAEGLTERVRLVAGDFYVDELPGDCDLALLSAIIHQNSPEENLAFFKKIYRCLAPGGALLIRDHVMDEARTNPTEGALFALLMLTNTKAGDTYTLEEIRAPLEAAGFGDVRLTRSGEMMDCLVEAKKNA